MKKIMMGLVIAVLATAQLANANTFMDRRVLLDKTKSAGKKPIEIGYNSTTTGAKKEELFFCTISGMLSLMKQVTFLRPLAFAYSKA